MKQAGRLNSLLHVDFDLKHARKTERGIVLSRDDGTWTDEAFKSWFGVDKTFFIEKQLRLTIAGADRVRLVLVQVQATCDNAQGMPGPPPYLLGVECPETVVLELEPGPSLWLGPALEIDGEQRRVLISYRFAVGLPKGAVAEFSMLYRFREALANDLVTRWHSYGARPGIISFHAETKPPEPRGDSEAPFSHIKY